MKVELKGKQLIITMDVDSEPKPSGSGKSLIVASTHGNQKTETLVNGKPLVVSVNAYVKAA